MKAESFASQSGRVPEVHDRWESAARIFVFTIFAVCTVIVIWQSRSMSGSGMPMPGGWTMPMMWMMMPGQGFLGMAWMFLVMWETMMIAMMLPSSWPMLELHWRVARHAEIRGAGALTAVVAAGYFLVWLAFGVAVFFVGLGISRAAMTNDAIGRWIPAAGGIALILAGLYQFTEFKQSCLSHCREPLLLLTQHWKPDFNGALRLGLHHGAFCALCCWALMVMQAVLGLMNLAVMGVVAGVIAVEKLWSRGPLLARVAGGISIAFGIAILIRSLQWI